jgi:hypothetical protein
VSCWRSFFLIKSLNFDFGAVVGVLLEMLLGQQKYAAEGD